MSTLSTLSLLAILLAIFSGACASSTNLAARLDESTLAVQTIHDAEVGGASQSEQAADLLARAKSSVEYAHHLPGDPDHARRLYTMAQVDAELAVVITRRDAERKQTALFRARHATALSMVAP
jgi:hypothetical protein